MAHLFISAAHKSSGKTTVTLGLCRALRNRGLGVQAFKKGPDYIDPIWHGLAAGRPSYNLDFHMMAAGVITDLFARHAAMAGGERGGEVSGQFRCHGCQFSLE